MRKVKEQEIPLEQIKMTAKGTKRSTSKWHRFSIHQTWTELFVNF